MSNLFLRVLTALFLIPLVISAIYLGDFLLLGLLSVVALLVSKEIFDIVYPKNFHTYLPYLLVVLLFLPLALLFESIVGWLIVFISFFIVQIITLFSVKIDVKDFEKICTAYFFCFYVFIALACIVWLQSFSLGVSFTFMACIATWLNDSFAYFTGRLIGKRSLFISVSQKKTWEGFMGGAFFSVFLSVVLSFCTTQLWPSSAFTINLSDTLWICMPVIFLAPLGDLIESRLKRFYNVKDSSGILPGHGGILDRIDALLTVLPWTCIYAFIIRPLC